MRWAGPVALVLVLLPAPTIAVAAGGGCTQSAHVRWQVDLDRAIVERAIVEVPNCADGELVGLQLLTAAGDVPAEPLVSAVDDARAAFDLAPHTQGIGPTTGVRVLHPSGDVAGDGRIQVVVERRFFDHADDEQRGLREVEALQVEVAAQYLVAGAPDGYRMAWCSDMGVAVPEDVVGEGAGAFTAAAPGRHLVCHRSTPGSAPAPSHATEVLHAAAAGAGDAVAGQPSSASGALPGALARTGTSVAMLLGLAMLLLTLGWRLTHRRT